ncbi:MAG: chlorophyll synthesis pathway protein BchC [Acetobacteraceae bacterium]|nr:chlorophyll synthesis pathway protein BchC [Acetobacteraceae bacterium]
MDALAVVLNAPLDLSLRSLALDAAGPADVVVDVEWSGVSTGTERLLWSGAMPPFPGMGYPLVPGYESVGRIVGGERDGERVFVPGARCFGPVHGLFGATASRIVVPGTRALAVGDALGEEGILLALAATAQHALAGFALPELIVGHGVLGRLLARLTVLAGGAPTVWERNPDRAEGAAGYSVLDPAEDPRRDYRAIYDASGDAGLIDALVMRLAPGGEIVLAGFYAERPSFAFPPAFMREARFRIAAQWQPADLATVRDMAVTGGLSLAGLITHRAPAVTAPDAYRTAFENAECLKMVLDWKARP